MTNWPKDDFWAKYFIYEFKMWNKKQIKDPLGIEPCPLGPMIYPVSQEDLCNIRFFITSKNHCWLIYRKLGKIVKFKHIFVLLRNKPLDHFTYILLSCFSRCSTYHYFFFNWKGVLSDSINTVVPLLSILHQP